LMGVDPPDNEHLSRVSSLLKYDKIRSCLP
jgi:hypothetical protein